MTPAPFSSDRELLATYANPERTLPRAGAILRAVLLIAGPLIAVLSSSALPARAAQSVSYIRQIRPILQRRCQGCHQPANLGGKLSLASYADVMRGAADGPVVLAGRPSQSLIVKYITGDPPLMPKNQPPVPAAEVKLIQRWIAAGAHDDTPVVRDAIDADHPPVYPAPPVIPALAFSPDGSLLAVAGYREVLLEKPDGGGIVARLVGTAPTIESLVFSSNGSMLVAAGGDPARSGQVQFWDVPGRKLINTVDAATDTVFGASLSPDGSRVAVGCADNAVRVFSAPAGKLQMKFDNHNDWVLGTAFASDNQHLLSASRDQAIKLILMDGPTGSFIDDINTHHSAIRCLVRAPSPPPAPVKTPGPGAVVKADPNNPKADVKKPDAPKDSTPPPPDDRVLCGGDDGVLRLYKVFRTEARTMNQEDHNLIREYDALPAPITALAVSADGVRAAVGDLAGDIRVFRVADGHVLVSLKEYTGGIYALSFHPDGERFAAAGLDGHVRVFAPTGQALASFVPVPIEHGLVAQREVRPSGGTLPAARTMGHPVRGNR